MIRVVASFERVNELLSYDLETGKLYWKVFPRRGVKEGSEAGSIDKYGYLRVGFDGVSYKAHRVAHFLMTGHWPDGNPEHENQTPSDNSWKNIRDIATSSENHGVIGLVGSNTSGLKGVTWDKRYKKWRSQITFRRKYVFLGLFTDLRLAGLTYDAAAKLAWGLRFSCLNFPSEESDHIVLPERVLRKLEQ
jgi:hypothetical protein